VSLPTLTHPDLRGQRPRRPVRRATRRLPGILGVGVTIVSIAFGVVLGLSVGQWVQSFHPKATAVADVQVNAEGRYPD